VEKELDFGRIDKRTPRKEFLIEMANTGNSLLVIIKGITIINPIPASSR